jgi:predicted HicB family RNase H-like nuclease
MRIGQFVKYKGYIGSIDFYPEDKSYDGVILDIDDFVNYQAENIISLNDEFHKAVDDYIEFRSMVDKEKYKL